MKNYPKIDLTIEQGNPSVIVQVVSSGETGLAIITGHIDDYPESGKLPCYERNHAVIVPHSHSLLDCRNPLSLGDLASFPLATYEFAFSSGSSTACTFNKAHTKQPDVALSAADTDVLKIYVRLGLGVGLMARTVHDPVVDRDLQLIDAAHLFEPSLTWITLRIDTYLRGYAYGFI